MVWELLTFVLGVACSAGIFVERIRRLRNDVTGVRKLLNAEIAISRARFIHQIVVLTIMSEGKDVKMVMDLLKRDVD